MYSLENSIQPISDRLLWAAGVDLHKDKFIPTSKGGVCVEFADWLDGVGSYSHFLEVYAEYFVLAPYREQFREALAVENVLACLKEGRNCTANYAMNTVDGSVRRMNMTLFSADGNPESGNCVLTVATIDNEYNILTQLEENEQLHTRTQEKDKAQLMMLQSLDAVFNAISLINLQYNTFQEVISGEGLHPVLQDIEDAQQALNLVAEVFVSAPDQNNMRQFFDLSTLSARLALRKGVTAEFYSTRGRWVRMSFIPVVRATDNTVIEVLWLTQLIDDEKQAEIQYQVALKDALTELSKSQKKLAHELDIKTEQLDDAKIHDSVTGLLRMHEFLRVVADYLAFLTEDDVQNHVIVYCNIRNFRHFNYKYGTIRGDELLCYIAEMIQRLPDGIFATRIEGDHFAILAHKKNLEQELKRCFIEVKERYPLDDLWFQAGYYTLKNTGSRVYRAMDLAKAACLVATNEGLPYKEYDVSLERKLNVERYVQDHVNDAIENGWLKVYYQPVMRTATKKVCGYEALVRWIDPVYGFLPPSDFIPVLEATGNVHKIDKCVIRQVCQLLRSDMDKGKTVVPISVNLSREDFIKCDIVSYVEEVTQEYAIPRNLLNIEITETTIMLDVEFMQKRIQRFRELGFQVWMDDFGSGYSSLNALKSFTFDEIKLDMGFMSDFDQASMHIIETIIDLCKKMGVSMLAEGVETQEQYWFLDTIGCEKIQGYYISKPMPMEDLPEYQLDPME